MLAQTWSFIVLALAMSIDELYFHRKREMPRWERFGHPLDTLSVLACCLFAFFFEPNVSTAWVFLFLAAFSCVFITKDEWVHAKYCSTGEHILHGVLFFLHPIVLWQVYGLWTTSSVAVFGFVTACVAAVMFYQLFYWNYARREDRVVDNNIYDHYGERWYTANDDPVALLRAENKTKTKWILEKLKNYPPTQHKVLDVGCGAGFLANALAGKGYSVTGVDLSEPSLGIARKHDATGKVEYINANALSLPFEDGTFSVITCLDFLEHVPNPEEVIRECARVLKPGGVFFFHTFNRNLLSRVFVLKGVEWVVKNTPKHLHLYDWFIKPKELEKYCERVDLSCLEWTGLRPRFSKAFFQLLRSGVVPTEFEFVTTSSLALSYLGVAEKNKWLSAKST